MFDLDALFRSLYFSTLCFFLLGLYSPIGGVHGDGRGKDDLRWYKAQDTRYKVTEIKLRDVKTQEPTVSLFQIVLLFQSNIVAKQLSISNSG